mgnify:CR=1 FL=1
MTTDLLYQMARTLSTRRATNADAPSDDEALYTWVADHLGVRIPRRACCPEHRAPFDAFAAAYFARSPIALWVAIAGAAFSLDFKAGWSHRHTAGYGGIILAIVIFGGWNPLRAAVGAYLFGILQSMASVAQSAIRRRPAPSAAAPDRRIARWVRMR